MGVVEWKDCIKIVTGELTRSEFLELARDVQKVVVALKDMDDEAVGMHINDIVLVKATREVYLKNGTGDWHPIGGRKSFEFDGVEYWVELPPTSEMLNALPMSLTLRWAESAANDNKYITQSLFFEQGGAES